MDVRISWSGEIDEACRETLLAEIQAALGAEGVTQLVIDLLGVTFIDCTGIGNLVTARIEAEDRGVVLTLADLSPVAARMLRLTGLTGLFGLDG